MMPRRVLPHLQGRIFQAVSKPPFRAVFSCEKFSLFHTIPLTFPPFWCLILFVLLGIHNCRKSRFAPPRTAQESRLFA